MKVVFSLLIEKRATRTERALSRKRTPQRNARAAPVMYSIDLSSLFSLCLRAFVVSVFEINHSPLRHEDTKGREEL
jgi:hypothetical protein